MALSGLFVKVVVSVLLWPLSLVLGAGLLLSLQDLPYQDSRVIALGSGILAYLAIQIFFWKPLFVYVMGHELTHALAAVIQGGKADDMRVSSKGGMVKVNKTNFLVNLAPYFFPIYTAMLLVVYWLSQERFRLVLIFALGLSIGFHWALTAYSMKQHQSDIHDVGWLFAIPFILTLNIVIFALLLGQVLPAAFSLKTFGQNSWAFALRGAAWAHSLF